ncbi:MAG: hypothetical protein C4K60_12665 [Ideonella sp. MAG2]|nr:MAG: hypothetical protein C4K60_12665 [Ideonella sp. MAG2]
MNETVDLLCELIGGASVEALLERNPRPHGNRGEARLTPSFLTTPASETYLRSPSSGAKVAEGVVFFSDYDKGLVQLVQQPLPRHADTRYSYIINFASFDGNWMSLVLDSKKLLNGLPAGKARLGLMIEAIGSAQVEMASKVTWQAAEVSREVLIDTRPNQVCVAQADLDYINPESTESLDLHLMFNPPARGSVEIRRLTLTLDIQPEPVKQQQLEGVFEDEL